MLEWRNFASVTFIVGQFFSIVSAQPATLKIAVATNDKALHGYWPYQTAIASKFGEEFMRTHQPRAESRRACKWFGGEWAQCGYLEIRGADSLAESDLQMIESILKDPCPYIEKSGLRTVLAKRKDADQEKQNLLVETRFAKLKKFCTAGAFKAGEVRKISKVEKANQKNTSEIAFEARIFDQK